MTAIVSMAAGLIHVSAAVDHRAMTDMFVGFLVVAALQVALALLLLWRRPRAPLLAAGIALMVVAVGLWVVSRTAGLPLIENGHREAIGVADGITVLLELAAIPGLMLLMSRELSTMSLPSHRLGTRAVSLVGAGAFALMTPALILGDRHGSGTQVAHRDGGHTARAGAVAHAKDTGAHPGASPAAGHSSGDGSRGHARARHTAKRHGSGSGHRAHSGAAGATLALHGHGSGSSRAGAGHRPGARGHRGRDGSGSRSSDPHGGNHGNHGGDGKPESGPSGNPGPNEGGGGQPSPQQTVESLVQSLTGVDPPR